MTGVNKENAWLSGELNDMEQSSKMYKKTMKKNDLGQSKINHETIVVVFFHNDAR